MNLYFQVIQLDLMNQAVLALLVDLDFQKVLEIH